MFSGFAIYGYSDHKTNITIEFALKNNFRTYITLIWLVVLNDGCFPVESQVTHIAGVSKIFEAAMAEW